MGRYPDLPANKREASPWLNGDATHLYDHYFSRLVGVATTRYKWVGLPDSVDPFMLEQLLVMQGGLAVFTHLRPDETLADGVTEAANGRFTVMRASYGGGGLDDMFNPASYRAYGPRVSGGGTFKTTAPLDEWHGVPIWGDSQRMDYDGETIRTFANRLTRAALVVDINLAATTRGVAMATTQDKLVSVQMLVDNALSGLTTFVTNEQDIAAMKTVDFGVHPDTVVQSHVVYTRLWNEALLALGVRAGATEKQERLTDDEVQAITGAVLAVRERTLLPRQRAAALINRRYFDNAPIISVVDNW